MTDLEKAELHLIQEMSELTKVLTKIHLYGENPTHKGITYNNVEDLYGEMGDVMGALRYIAQKRGMNFGMLIERSGDKCDIFEMEYGELKDRAKYGVEDA